VAGRRRAPGPTGRASDGQHLLRSAALAAELVDRSDIGPDDVVVEIGGGTGRLTAPLAASAGRLLVIERDPRYAALLRDRFASARHVEIVCGNALDVPLPAGRFRVFGSLPFAFGTRILRRLLDDPGTGMDRLDALLQFEVARKRAQLVPGTVVSIGWLPWWEFVLTRRVSRAAFEPVPSVDAGMLSVLRRPRPLLSPDARPAFVAFIARAFAAPGTPVGVSARRRLPPAVWKRIAIERGLPFGARPADLGVEDWVVLFTATRAREAARRRRP
jgi:23S rRNA (adenine-N6)-dimethyltransferase